MHMAGFRQKMDRLELALTQFGLVRQGPDVVAGQTGKPGRIDRDREYIGVEGVLATELLESAPKDISIDLLKLTKEDNDLADNTLVFGRLVLYRLENCFG